MAIRLDYETSAGNLSTEHTYKQLLEQLRLAQEDAQLLSNACKGRSDIKAANAWKQFATNFQKIQKIVEHLATQPAKPSSLGYTNAYYNPFRN